ncbi:isochorismate synthase [Halostella salina]|uniref:isochorismate synthase n=1 Tax=Halostella salina TaxID=1547897 RepID=UPI000EF81493|nr:isochorismate synthase [Halostella salina]
METQRSGPAADAPLVTRSRAIPAVPVRTALDAFDAPRAVWAAPGEPTVAGCGAAATVVADENRFAAVREAADDLFGSFDDGAAPPARPRLFGGFAFHDDHDPEPPWEGFPPAYFVLPRVQVTTDGDDAWVTVNAVGPDDQSEVDNRLDAAAATLQDLPGPGPPAAPPGVAERRPTTGRDEWREQVEGALARIDGGDLTKVVLAQALGTRLERDLSVPDALAALRATYPDCHRFLIDGRAPGDAGDAGRADGSTLFGATPERLASVSGRRLETEALAGSTGRGDTPEEDEWLARELLDSEKDVREHEIVTEAVREQIAPFAASVRTGPRTVRKLDTVQHLRTPVSADLDDAEHVLDVVEALHPTPAVGGLPPDRALRTIRETETFDRGWYAAPVGWFDAAGNGTFAVAIRSAVARGDAATLFAGAGIVADSDPEREWDEIQLKYRPVLDALER